MAGDVYARPPHVGRGGWTWYTGSAAGCTGRRSSRCSGLRSAATSSSSGPACRAHWSQAELRLTRAGKSLRLLFVRASDAAPEALAAAASARLLGVGETVRWSSLDGAVPLLVVMADAGASRPAAAAEFANAG